MRPQVGQVINNKYRLLRIIGDGGMGSVYEARHELLNTTVALKFLHPELSKRSGLVQRFMQEAQVSAQIQSPHVVRVMDVDQAPGGVAYIVMEYLEGKTLQTLYEDLYRAGQRLGYPEALEYAMQMLEGVEAAHAAGIVHRDLKPDNVIITKDKRGEPLLKLLDFGIAKLKVTGQMDRGLTRPGVVMGTPEYMAPEQAFSADAVDLRADIFSLGVMIFEMLAGRRPVGGDEPQQIATAYLSGQIAKLNELAPQIAADLAAVVHKAMAPKPQDRFASVAAFRTALDPYFRTAKGGSLTSPATPMPGNVTPVPAVSPAPGSPSTNVPSDQEPRAVPKTIPPEEPLAPLPSALVASGEAAPIQTTSAGGFAASPSGEAVAPIDPLRSTEAAGYAPLGNQFNGPPSNVAAAGLPPTVEAQPYMMANAVGYPLQGLPPTVSAPPFSGAPAGGYPPTAYGNPMVDPAARPGGTAVGASPYNAAGAPSYPMVPQGTQSGLPPTAAMNPLSQYPYPAQASPQQKAQGGGTSMFTILLIAASISALVVGGLYAAQRFLKPVGGDSDPTVASTQPTTPVPPGSVASVPQDPPPTAPPPTTPPTTPPTGTTGHTDWSSKPPVAGTGPKPPGTAPSATPSSMPPPMFPSSFPTIVIPSTFPGFPLPGQSIPHPTNPGQPTAQPPPTAPTTTSTRPRITVPKPTHP